MRLSVFSPSTALRYPFRANAPVRSPIEIGLILGVLALCAAGCSLFGSGDTTPILDADARSARIEILRQTIRNDHETLESLITQPEQERSVDLHRNPEIEKIAKRLGRHERELAQLVELERDIKLDIDRDSYGDFDPEPAHEREEAP